MNGASPAHTLVSTTTVASGQWKQWRRRWFRRFPFFTGYSLYARAKRRNYAWSVLTLSPFCFMISNLRVSNSSLN
ncbi:predicted protein [Arabidopsis lyrata subsp. lyrata]|uniref:Predicted protein n=1 Tax=Arabidopsis lyrata subsp. lyrata TaxID=81972 RepID=D7MLU8_ARALL|nr:predicted protein [Arabidopsis lyrata subsp. lyrata]